MIEDEPSGTYATRGKGSARMPGLWLRLGMTVLALLALASLRVTMDYAFQLEKPSRPRARATAENVPNRLALEPEVAIEPSLPLPPPSPYPPPPLPKLALPQCHARDHAEYDGAGVAIWGNQNIVLNADACCDSCRTHRENMEASGKGNAACLFWVFCGNPGGCAGGQKQGACWGKTGYSGGDSAIQSNHLAPQLRNSGKDCGWVSAGRRIHVPRIGHVR